MTKKRSKEASKATPQEGGAKPQKQRRIEALAKDIFAQRFRNPVDEAQDVMYDAWEASTRKQAISLARKALKISSDCADAYVMLAAETARSTDEAIELYAKGVEAGERALGERLFREYEGSFWGYIETRPYMRARCGLAVKLWDAGRREEAVEHYWEMLRLNPNDNQGIRDLLMPCLIELGRDKDAERLHKQYRNDGMAVWRFSRALLDFRKGGDCATARKSLKTATSQNEHVTAYLLGHKKMPRELPEYYSPGKEDEALFYVDGNRAAWRATPGALNWLRALVT